MDSKKEQVLYFRVDSQMAAWIKAEAKSKKMTTSGVLRLLLNEVLRNRHDAALLNRRREPNHISAIYSSLYAGKDRAGWDD